MKQAERKNWRLKSIAGVLAALSGLAIQAATAGMGAAVVDRNLVHSMLSAGILAETAPDPPVPTEEGHWFVALPDRLRIRQVRQFRDWLVSEAAR